MRLALAARRGRRAAAQAARAAPGLRQTMAGLHSWVGLLMGWLLYAMFLTGTVSYFRAEISQWMRPEVPAQPLRFDAAVVTQRVLASLATLAPQASQWSIDLPDARTGTASAAWGERGRFETAIFDPATGHTLPARATRGGEFFYYFHFTLHYLPHPLGRWLVGLAAMGMLVALVSGVVTHRKIFSNFFTFRPRKGPVSWLDAHNALSVLGLPFHLMITYTGLVTLMTLYMPWGMQAALPGAQGRAALMAQLHVLVPADQPTGQAAALADVGAMLRQAEGRWGSGQVARVVVQNPGDAAARVVMVRGHAQRVSVSPQYQVFDGTDGTLLRAHDRVGAAAETHGVLYALHLGRFGDTVTRWLYFLVSLAGTAMVGTGLVLWTVKRRTKLPDPEHPHAGFRLVERLNIASIAGLSIAMAVFLWGNRLLPPDLEQRSDWEIHLLFIAWALALLHAGLRPARRAWAEQLWCATALLALLPVLNAVTTQRPLWRSLAAGDWVFAGFDLALWALAMLHALAAVRSAKHRSKAAHA